MTREELNQINWSLRGGPLDPAQARARMNASRALEREKARIEGVVGAFCFSMLVKLHKKADEGYRGWAQKRNRRRILRRLVRHVERLQNGEPQEVDIANLVMMLWYHRRR